MMIYLKSILIDEERVIGLKIKLPFTLLTFVFNTKGFLCGNEINLETLYLNKACICIISNSNNYEECLNSEVISMNKKAQEKGIEIGMLGKIALKKMHEN